MRSYPQCYTFSPLLNRIQKGEYIPNIWLISSIHWSHYVCFCLHFFLLLLIIAIMGVYSESVWKWRFFYFLPVFYFLYKCGDNFAPTITCKQTLKKIRISLRKSLTNCQMLRWILKAAAMQKLSSDLSFLMFFFILNMALTYLLK